MEELIVYRRALADESLAIERAWIYEGGLVKSRARNKIETGLSALPATIYIHLQVRFRHHKALPRVGGVYSLTDGKLK